MTEKPVVHTEKTPESDGIVPPESWTPRPPKMLERAFFDLQMEFAKILAEKTGKPLFEIVGSRTAIIRSMIYNFDDQWQMTTLKPGVTPENAADYAYDNYQRIAHHEPVPYHTDGSTRFGCVYYDRAEDGKTIRIHFTNNESDVVGPLDKTKVEDRKREFRDALIDIKKHYPDATEITGLSWLYNLPAYRQFFPESYLASIEMNEDPGQWLRGTTVWGQFLDSDGKVKQEAAHELIARLKDLRPGSQLADMFKEKDSHILPPLSAKGSLSDFYKMYGIEA